MSVPEDPSWPERFASLVRQSGLTGRGGASFPSGAKLELLRSSGRAKTIVVNAMEGEPASDKARVLLECTPHLVLDGAEIVAAALGATRIALCVSDTMEATAHVAAGAIAERERTDLAPVPVDILRPPGRYVSGEESALASWVDGRSAVPRFRPDKSVPLTISRAPALVHNVETLAQIALIARHGPAWFRERGTVESPGTFLVTVSGEVERPGVYEVDMGTPVSSLLDRAVPSAPVTSFLVGGYEGTWLPRTAVDTPLAPESLRPLGASVGAGVVAVLSLSACGITESARLATYLAGESAGQCGPCVFGLPAIAEDLGRIANGVVDRGILSRLHSRLNQVDGRGGCRHPDGVAHMVRSALDTFAEDVAAHVAGRPCPPSRAPSSLRLPPPIAGHRGVGAGQGDAAPRAARTKALERRTPWDNRR